MDRTLSRLRLPLALACAACIGAAAVALAASPDGPSARRADRALHIEADCRLVDAVRLEPLGDEAGESAFAARARCSASIGPLRDASTELDLVWAFDRGRLEHDAARWRASDGALATPAGTSIVRREADGRWRADVSGRFGSAEGRAAGLVGRRYLLVARLDTSSLPPLRDAPDE